MINKIMGCASGIIATIDNIEFMAVTVIKDFKQLRRRCFRNRKTRWQMMILLCDECQKNSRNHSKSHHSPVHQPCHGFALPLLISVSPRSLDLSP